MISDVSFCQNISFEKLQGLASGFSALAQPVVSQDSDLATCYRVSAAHPAESCRPFCGRSSEGGFGLGVFPSVPPPPCPTDSGCSSERRARARVRPEAWPLFP